MRSKLALILMCTAPAVAQDFHPNTSITIRATGAELNYRSMTIPAGVTVTVVGSAPLVIRTLQDIHIEGTLDVSGYRFTPGPGGGIAGNGQRGNTPFGSGPGPGVNVVDPLAIPMQLIGGGNGGDHDYTICGLAGCIYSTTYEGSGGGGAVRLEAQGALTVAPTGRILANAGSYYAPAAGGTIHLRSFGPMQVAGTVSALGSVTSVATGAPGVICLESYARRPVVGTGVSPAPVVWELPRIREVSSPVVGSTWELAAAAGHGNGVFVAISVGSANVVNSYGTFQLDPTTAGTLGILTTAGTLQGPQQGEPVGMFRFPVPGMSSLRGLTFEVQGLNWTTQFRQRYTNAFATTIR